MKYPPTGCRGGAPASIKNKTFCNRQARRARRRSRRALRARASKGSASRAEHVKGESRCDTQCVKPGVITQPLFLRLYCVCCLSDPKAVIIVPRRTSAHPKPFISPIDSPKTAMLESVAITGSSVFSMAAVPEPSTFIP